MSQKKESSGAEEADENEEDSVLPCPVTPLIYAYTHAREISAGDRKVIKTKGKFDGHINTFGREAITMLIT